MLSVTPSSASDIGQILKRELSLRSGRNPRYSLRAFARDLDLTAPTLCRIMRGDRGISKTKASSVAARLDLSSDERVFFVELAEALHSRVRSVRTAAQTRLSLLADQFDRIDPDAFQIVAEWHHYGILSLLELDHARHSVPWLSQQLGISRLQVEDAVERLLRNGMLRRAGRKFVVTGNFFAESHQIPSHSIRYFHEQLLTKASQAIHEQTLDEREFCTLVMPTAQADMAEAKRWIRKFRAEFDARFSAGAKKKDQVMVFSMQYYSLNKTPRKKVT